MMAPSSLSSATATVTNYEPVEVIHPDLMTLDYSQPRLKLTLVAASYGLWASLYVSTASLASYSGLYRSLGVKEKLLWTLAMVRSYFACVCAVVGVWAMVTDTAMDKDVVYGTTPTSHFTLCVTVGFYLFECSALCVCDVIFSTVSILVNVHHWLSLVTYTLILYTGAAHSYGCKSLVLEMVSPLSTLSWTLLRTGRHHTLLWKATQFLLVHAFHTRSVVECVLWYSSYRHWTDIWATMPVWVLVAVHVHLALGSLVLTPYWTFRRTVQMVHPEDWGFAKLALGGGGGGGGKED